MIFGREPSYLFESLEMGDNSGCRVNIPETLIFRQVSNSIFGGCFLMALLLVLLVLLCVFLRTLPRLTLQTSLNAAAFRRTLPVP